MREDQEVRKECLRLAYRIVGHSDKSTKEKTKEILLTALMLQEYLDNGMGVSQMLTVLNVLDRE